jgi:hypothetical protein
LSRKGKGNLAYLAFTLVMSGIVLAAFALIDWTQASADVAVFVLFLALLPLLNAVFDYASYALTFWLLRAGFWRPRYALLAGLVDLAAACLLLLVSAAAIVLAIALANHVAGHIIYDIPALLDGLRQRPGDYWWLFAMLFSTLVPTLLHLTVALFSLGAWLAPAWRARVVRAIDDTDVMAAAVTPLVIALIWTLTLGLASVIFWALWAMLWWGVPQWYGGYLNWLDLLASWGAGQG